MSDYVRELIDVSRGGAAVFSPTEADVRAFFARVHSQAEALAAAEDVRLTWGEDAQLPETLQMDEALFERAVLNVVANAVEHAPAGSLVEVAVRADESGSVVVEVSDEGPGFSPESLRRACEPFYQGDPARATQGHSGLGLHTAARAATLHGGILHLTNRDPAGARVTLQIPRLSLPTS